MNGKAWTMPELARLRALYPHYSTPQVASMLGRSAGSVYNKALVLGLHKTPEYLATESSGRIQRGRKHPRMVASQFKPGLRPWNTGLKGWTAPGSEATQFKPGTKPVTTMALGSLRICDGQLQRKMSETPGPNHRRWVPVSRLVWQAERGPIPPGHIVVFRAGMATTELDHITIDKLDCITRAENARRNHPRNKHPELARLVQLKGAITRQVKRITQEAAEQARQQQAHQPAQRPESNA